jgi:hypothetical protein
MPNLNLYIPDREVPLVNAARRVAGKRDVSLGRVILDALMRDLPRQDAEQPSEKWAAIAADAA